MSTSPGPRRRRKTVLSPSAKYEIWLRLVRGEATISQAAADAGVDRSTIIRVRKVAKDGALAALAASKPGSLGKSARDVELDAANAEVARLSEAVKELAVKLTLLEGKGGAGLMPAALVPARVDAATKAALLDLIGHAVGQGWPLVKACEVLGVEVRRARRWTRRAGSDADAGLVDARPGGSVNGLTPQELDAILAAFETFGEKDFSHRRLAHRGSYEGLFWASPSTVRRVLNDHDLRFRHPPRPARGQRRPFPHWASYTPNSIWIYDTTHFPRCGMNVLIIEDLVSRKWITHVVSPEETHTQVQLAFEQALDAEDLLETALGRADALGRALGLDGEDELTPILLAVSDNGSQMIAADTRKFMAMVAIAQHFGRPCTPTDQAWIESFNGHLKIEWPHLNTITDPALLRAELDPIRDEYNTRRLHSGIGYVTPDDEHSGRGPSHPPSPPRRPRPSRRPTPCLPPKPTEQSTQTRRPR